MTESHSKASICRQIFASSEGIRPGWSLALFLTIYSALTLGTQFAFATIPALRAWSAAQPHGVITALSQIEFTGLELIILLIGVILVSRVERRTFRDYGLSQTKTAGRRFALGFIFGFGMASALVGLIALDGGYAIRGLAISGGEIASNAVLYGCGFLIVGFFEEFAFRGYMQATLQRGIGFWPAAIILSLLFGAIHLPNLKGAWFGAVVAATFGLVAAFSLKRTDTLWFIIGLHAAFDWSNTFFYSSPITGLTARGQLFNANLHGPDWLTGGAAGPVESVMALIVMMLAGVLIHLTFPAAPSPACGPEGNPIEREKKVSSVGL
jgi:hypothetical protein